MQFFVKFVNKATIFKHNIYGFDIYRKTFIDFDNLDDKVHNKYVKQKIGTRRFYIDLYSEP
jgi:hypothetical protein